MARKPFNKGGISKLPANKPILYELETAGGNSNYVGVAKKGRVRDRLNEHLPSGPDPIPAKITRCFASNIHWAKVSIRW